MKQKFDENGMRLQAFNRGGNGLTEITGDDAASALLQMGIESLKMKQPSYANTPEGLQAFKEKTLEYFNYVQAVNADKEEKNKLLCDIESWAVFMGVTRQTINGYSAKRGENWYDFIARTKDIIMAQKKVRAFSGQIPPILMIFDAVNNHSYQNTSDIRIEAVQANSIEATKTPEEIAAQIEADIPVDADPVGISDSIL